MERCLGATPDYDYAGLDLLSVVPDAAKVLCVALNFHDHIAEANRALPGGREASKYPNTFIRFADSLIGHRQPLIRPRVSQRFDYEAELMVIMRDTPRHVAREDALKYVFGYSILNEGSIRDYQFHARQLTPGKNFAASGSTGPYIVTADEIGDPQTLALSLHVNGDQKQSGNSKHMLFGVAQLIADISSGVTLEPGDVIATGSPQGVGAAQIPPQFLQPGDVVEATIEKIGTLRNPVVDARVSDR